MFARLLSITSLAILAIATPHSYERRGSSQCDTDNLQCCQQTESVSFIPLNAPQTANTRCQVDEFNSGMGGLLGLQIPANILGSVGLGCTPISVVGLGSGATCTQQPVCCSGDSFVRTQPPFPLETG